MADVSGSARDPACTPQPIRRIGALALIAGLTLPGANARAAALDAPVRNAPGIEAASPGKAPQAGALAELQGHLLRREPDVDLFRVRGPFGVTKEENRELRLTAAERIKMDVFRPAHAQKAPLVVFLHGDDSSKGAHAKQAEHLASWGMHALAVQLSGKGPWDVNGRVLGRLVRLIHRAPGAIDKRIDTGAIMLVGHSFGAYAVAVAIAEGAPAAGAILLDPAGVARGLPDHLRRIQKPVMVLGADDDDVGPRNRSYFYEYIRGGVAEVSIRDAVHDDAQYPSEFALRHGGVDPNTTEALQVTFVSALAAAAVSLSATGTFDYAWASFQRALQNGTFFNAKKK